MVTALGRYPREQQLGGNPAGVPLEPVGGAWNPLLDETVPLDRRCVP